jgi:hypothetical protein
MILTGVTAIVSRSRQENSAKLKGGGSHLIVGREGGRAISSGAATQVPEFQRVMDFQATTMAKMTFPAKYAQPVFFAPFRDRS